jgi:class 3 adenylate cyclase
MLERHNDEVETTVRSRGGEIMKNLGDGYIAIFGDASDFFSSGVEIQKKIGRFEPLPELLDFALAALEENEIKKAPPAS